MVPYCIVYENDMDMDIIVVGCGGRGHTYARYAKDHGLRVVAAADSQPDKLQAFGKEFDIPAEMLFGDWRQALQSCNAVALINATPDREHYQITVAALEKGLHVLLEKPMSPSEEECRHMVALAEEKGLVVMVCHVLRYAPFFEKIQEIISSGEIGTVTNLVMTENVVYWHFAHSYVRGIFSKEDSSPFILAKSCHDLDLIVYLTGKKCLSVMSEGELGYFRAENAPADAPMRCLDGCPHETACPYFAPRLYMKSISHVGWPSTVISTDTSYDARYQALKTGRYGRCVYRCDNDVNDRQSALFVMEDGVLASFNMTGFSSENTRTLRIFGTKGDVRAHMDDGEIVLSKFLDDQQQTFRIDAQTLVSAHGGGDTRLLGSFAAALRGDTQDMRTCAATSLQSHLMAFAAEESRKTGRRVYIKE